MAKVFYTERDIEDMVQRGVGSLLLTDDVVLTELAYERAKRLGLKLDHDQAAPPSAPVRPYLSEPKTPQTGKPACACEINKSSTSSALEGSLVKDRVRNAVKAHFGEKVDDKLLEAIIQRVLNSVGV